MTRSLRIAILLNPFDLGVKGGDWAPQLARELLNRGHTVRGFGAPAGVIPRSSEAGDGDGDGSLLGFAPEIIVAYDALSPAALKGARACHRLEVPLILVESGFSGPGRWHERLLRWLGQKLWGPLVRRRAACVVALDPQAREQALSEGFESNRIEVQGAGVDLQHYRPGLTSSLVSHHRLRGRILLYAGRVGPGRGLECLIEAFARTVGQGRDWTLVLAGDGPLHGRKVLRALADRLGVGARLHWLQRPRAEELPGLMGSATLLCVPAVDDSVRGKQIPRALACGLPVIASKLPRLSALVRDGETGLLVAPGNLDAWSAALTRASASPQARKRWSQRAREVALEEFNWVRVAEDFEALLLRTLAAAPKTESPSELSPAVGKADL
ncbi:MAG: glycosyltransferase [bacterium]